MPAPRQRVRKTSKATQRKRKRSIGEFSETGYTTPSRRKTSPLGVGQRAATSKRPFLGAGDVTRFNPKTGEPTRRPSARAPRGAGILARAIAGHLKRSKARTSDPRKKR